MPYNPCVLVHFRLHMFETENWPFAAGIWIAESETCACWCRPLIDSGAGLQIFLGQAKTNLNIWLQQKLWNGAYPVRNHFVMIALENCSPICLLSSHKMVCVVSYIGYTVIVKKSFNLPKFQFLQASITYLSK